MPARSQRLPREHFTRLLLAIAREISTRPVHLVRCRDPFLQTPFQASFEILTIWAFGSWARGAPECGDLDLIVEAQHVGTSERVATSEVIASSVRRRRKYVDVQIGTPSTLGHIAEGAVLVWASWAPDYVRHIEAVRLDENAGRFTRRHDVIPLDPRRLRMPFQERDEIADAVARGEVSVAWVDADVIPEIEPQLRDWAQRSRLGADSLRVLPLAVSELSRWMLVEDIPVEWDRHGPAEIRVRDIRLSFERHKHSHRALGELGCRAVVVVPHWKRRGPNGVMSILRGHNHPLVQRFAWRQAWVLDDGFVLHEWGRRVARRLELFTSRERAEEAATSFGDDYAIRDLVGTRLLEAIDQADIVEVDLRLAMPITWEGAACLRDDLEEEPSSEPAADLLLRALPEVRR